MSRWGSFFRIAGAYLVGVYTGNWALLASQLAAEEGRRKRDSNNKRARREFNAAQKDRLEMVDIQPSAPRTLCLGRVRHVEGIRRRWSSGVHKEKATLIVSFAGHEIDGYEQWYLDDLPVTLDVDGYVQESSLGTGTGYTTNTSGYAIGATSIGLITGSGTILAGDTVRFNGDSTYYTVATGITGPGTLVLGGTGLRKAIAASAVTVEVVKSPFARPTRAQVMQYATYVSGTLPVTLSEPALAGTVNVLASDGTAGEALVATLTEGVDFTVSGTALSITSSPHPNITITFTSGQSIKAVRIRPYLGTATQNVGGDLAAEYPGFITSADKFAGIALAVVDFIYNPDSFPQSFPTVAPVFRGAKCYDPRKDSTYPGGSGAHRLADPSTWEFTENPSLHLQRYITWYSGLNLRTKDYSMADVFSEANVCAASTVFTLTATGGGTSTVTLPLYSSGITITADTDPRQGLSAILETMAGDYGWAGGIFRFRAGRMGTPVFAMDTSWLVQGVDDSGEPDGEAVITAVQGLPREQRVNRVTGRCVDRDQRYQMLPFPDVEDTVLIAAKGERPEEIDFAGVNHIAHAQHLGSIMIREAHAGQRLEVRCGWQALDLELFDVGTITHPRSGMSAKTQEVRGWQWNPAGDPFKVKLAEITAAMFDVQNPLIGRDPAPDSTLRRPWDVEQLGALTVTSGTAELADSGSIVQRMKVAWPAVVGENVRQGGEIEVQYHNALQPMPAGDWPNWPEQGYSTFTIIPGVQTGNVYLVRARAVQKIPLVRGQWTPVVVHKVAAIRGPTIFRQTAAPSGDVQDGDEWFDTDDGNKHYVREGGAWVSVRDSGIAQALADAADAQATADGKIATFYQASPPTAESVGDIWFDTDDGNKQYRWSGSAWVLAVDTRIGQAISDAADAQATADGKVTTFVSASAPTADAVGDLWLDSDDGNKLYRWNGSAWVALPVGTGGLGIDAATTTYADETGADSVSIGSGGGTNFKNGASRIYANTTGRNVVLQFDAEVTGLHFSAGATLASPDDYVVAQWVFEVNGTPVQSDSFIDSAGDSVPPDATAQKARQVGWQRVLNNGDTAEIYIACGGGTDANAATISWARTRLRTSVIKA
jgi:hypothetical protein